MEENLESNGEVSNETYDNSNKSNPEQIKESKTENVINMNENNAKTQNTSANQV